jgi:hypothetical protein
MPDEIRVNRPQAQPQAQYAKEPMMDQPEPKSGASKTPWIILGVVVLVLIIAALIFRSQLFGKPKTGSQTVASPQSAQASGYVAVFLTNGQVYFGKLSHPGDDYVTLDDIYYLQVGPQQGSATTPVDASSTAQQQISLVKLGNELHGPVDEMHISRGQILFYEELKSDGQVVKAILQDKASAATTPAPAK